MPESRTGAAPGGNRQQDPRWRALLVSLAVVLVVASVPAAAWAIPALVPPTQDENADETGAGEVIADGRARLPRGEIVWTIRQVDVPGGEGVAVEEFPIGFALVEAGTVALRAEDDEAPTELATGEAAFLPNRKAGTLASVGADAASLVEIALVSRRDAESAAEADAGEETAVVVGEPFPAPAGAAESAATPTPEGEEQAAASFEMELVRNTLSGQDEATIPVSGSGAPVVYLTTVGTAQLQAGEQVVDLDAGQFALLAGTVQVRAATDAPATFVVASIGEEAEARDRDRSERQREPRQRTGGGGGGGRQGNASAGGQGQSDRAARRAARQAARQAQGGGGGGGRGGQSQQQGTGDTGGAPVTGGADATATVPASVGTPGVEPTPEPTLPTDPTVPADGTPPAAETPPVDETAVPTATDPVAETPTPEPTVPVVPTNPPVPEVPGVPGLPTVPAEETVAAESVPAAEEPVPEATLPVEEVPAPVEEAQPTEPAPEG
jgi:hypothetical protein